MSDDTRRRIEERLKTQTRENRVSCAAAQAIAAELGIGAWEVGAIADHLEIRIHQCQLGCF